MDESAVSSEESSGTETDSQDENSGFGNMQGGDMPSGGGGMPSGGGGMPSGGGGMP